MVTRATTTRRNDSKSATAKRTGSKRARTAKNARARRTSAKKEVKATGQRSTTTRGAGRNSHRNSHGKRKWSAGVDTESTYPQEGLFKKDAETIARSLASKKVSPKGPASGMRMLTFYVNRAGKNLPQSRLRILERAKGLLHERVEEARSRKTKDDGESGRGTRRSH
jgi:Protein of unknown function (DUF3175)